MAFYVKVVNGTVTQCWDTPPPAGEPGWREAIENRPALGANQYYGTHSFDLTTVPAQIVWAVLDMTPEQIADAALRKVKVYTDAVQKALDDFAKTRNYSGIMSAITYSNSGNPKFAAEAAYCLALRDSVWTQCYLLLDQVQTGALATPTVDELVTMVMTPTPTWPV